LIDGLSIEIVAVTGETAVKMAGAYREWGRGSHPAKLNLGDCFAYALAKERACPLLFIGHDFAKTDIASAIGG
jgi:ribonuclease VapC